MVESTLNYLAAMTERPGYWLTEPPPGVPWRNTKGERRTVAIDDARELAPAPTLDREGVALIALATGADELDDADAIRARYYRSVERAVRDATGATRVAAFDHNLRSATVQGRDSAGVQGPVRYAHNDYTEASGPQRVRDLFPDEADSLLRDRFAVINVWKPLRRPVIDAPLAVCDARTIAPGDLIATDLRYADRTGEVYSMRFNPAHRWFYFSAMRPDEALLLKCYDSASGRARFTAHTAFDDPNPPADAWPRESIETRTFAFWD